MKDFIQDYWLPVLLGMLLGAFFLGGSCRNRPEPPPDVPFRGAH